MSSEAENEPAKGEGEKEHLLSGEQGQGEDYKGARPKVRPTEDKKRKGSGKKGPVVAPFPQGVSPAPGKRGSHGPYFGVRSYLHNFYESVGDKNPEEFEYLIKPSKRGRGGWRGAWRGSLVLGVLCLALGAVVMPVGHLATRRSPVVGHQEEMTIIDHSALAFNRNLEMCKVVGLVFFCVGGAVVAGALILHGCCCEDDRAPPSEPFRVCLGPEDPPPKSPTDKKVPATEALESIQPKRGDEEEMIMTNTGLCKIPP